MADRTLSLRERNPELSLADRAGSGAPRLMQLENKFVVEFWLFEDGSFVVWSDGELSLDERSLVLTIPAQ
jgi:hypothetical protein